MFFLNRIGFFHRCFADHFAAAFPSVRHLQQPASLHLTAAIVTDDDVTLHRASDEGDDRGRSRQLGSTDAGLPLRVLQPPSARPLGAIPATAEADHFWKSR